MPNRFLSRPQQNQDLRRAAVSVGWRIAVACAVMVALVTAAVAAYLAYRSAHPHPADSQSPRVYLDATDMIQAMILAGAVGIVLAGAVGWVSANSAIRPLGRALAMQRRFVQDASHELRTPLAVLDARIQLAQRKAPPDSSMETLLGQLRADAKSLADTVEELLVAATGGASDGPEDVIKADDVVSATLAQLGELAAERGVNLAHHRVAGSAPWVAMHPHTLRRAVVALVDNALIHTPAGGDVAVTTGVSNGQFTLAVTDTGPGITGIDAERIFDRFARTSSTAPGRRRSFGLGLALVREIAEAAGGTISVQSTSNAGTYMLLTLPLAQHTGEEPTGRESADGGSAVGGYPPAETAPGAPEV